jgi:hypothetical protein
MKNIARLFILLAAVVALTACNKEKEIEAEVQQTERVRDITYTVAGRTTTVHLNTEFEWDALLDCFCDYAQGGDTVTFHNTCATTSQETKETVNFSTTSRDEMKSWMARMENEGMTVTVTYDPATGTWHGEAYATAPQPQPEPEPQPSSIIIQFKVGHKTHQLKGYHTDTIYGYNNMSDTIPFRMEYQEPCDFGYLRLLYDPTNDTLLNCELAWTNSCYITYPTYNTNISSGYVIIPYPGMHKFYYAVSDGETLDHLASIENITMNNLCNALWDAVANTLVFQSYYDLATPMTSHPNIGVYSVQYNTFANYSEGDYILFIEKRL